MTETKDETECMHIELVPPGPVRIGDVLLPGGVAFALQCDRPEMLTTKLAGIPWTEELQAGVLLLVRDLMLHRTELRLELGRMKEVLKRKEIALNDVRDALDVMRDRIDYVPSVEDDDDLDDEED